MLIPCAEDCLHDHAFLKDIMHRNKSRSSSFQMPARLHKEDALSIHEQELHVRMEARNISRGHLLTSSMEKGKKSFFIKQARSSLSNSKKTLSIGLKKE